MEFSIVVPVYNEEASLTPLQKRLHEVMGKTGSEYEIIYVDDNSKDSSLNVLEGLKKEFPQISIISLKEHKGQSVALFVGFKSSKGRWIITLDADLQNPPGEICELLKFKNDFDFITGIRIKRRDSIFRKASSKIAQHFRQAVLRDTTKDTGCSLRMFKREVIDSIYFFDNFHRFFTFLVRKKGFRIKEVYVKHGPRKFGKSKYGTLERAVAGLFDLFGVFWLMKRSINYEIKHKC
jgi:glycosyltransferase involved in cell wall biosynthesis